MDENEKLENYEEPENPAETESSEISETSEVSENSENSENSEQSAASDNPEASEQEKPATEAIDDIEEGSPLAAEKPSLEQLIAEAEQRGYLRGRNEKIEQLMSAPGLYERIDSPRATPTEASESNFELLRHQRVSIWDR